MGRTFNRKVLGARTGQRMAAAMLWSAAMGWGGTATAAAEQPVESAPDSVVRPQPAAVDTVEQEGDARQCAPGDSPEEDGEEDGPRGFLDASWMLLEDGSMKLVEAPRSATDQTAEAVRWLAKRRQLTVNGVPYGVTGLPIFYYSANTGWNYGARLHWADYQRRPYRYKVTVHTLHSTRNRSDSYVQWKVPRISDTGFGVVLLLSDRRDIRVRYYGRGNATEKVDAYTDPESPRFRDENYYYYVLEQPSLVFTLVRHLHEPVSLSLVFGMASTTVSPRGDRCYYRDAGTPGGVRDGETGSVGARLTWDSRDDDTVPKRGVFHEWSYETSRNSFLGLFFEEIDFRRYTITDARYVPVTERLNLAQRAVFEVLKGDIPLYAYGEIGGAKRIKGLGGGDALRGYDTQRFTDNVRFFTNTEVRYRVGSHRFYRQYLEWNGVLFFDTGRVWRNIDELSLSGLHCSGGAGLRIYWNTDFVIRFSIAVSPEQIYTPVKYRNVF